jgi:PIN domain nuclease of toxin-antitoxin system
LLTTSAGTQPLLLDSHVWVWPVVCQPGTLAPPVLAAIHAASARRELLVSIVSVWEIALPQARQRSCT